MASLSGRVGCRRRSQRVILSTAAATRLMQAAMQMQHRLAGRPLVQIIDILGNPRQSRHASRHAGDGVMPDWAGFAARWSGGIHASPRPGQAGVHKLQEWPALRDRGFPTAPSRHRGVGMPLSADTPAPVNTTRCRAVAGPREVRRGNTWRCAQKMDQSGPGMAGRDSDHDADRDPGQQGPVTTGCKKPRHPAPAQRPSQAVPGAAAAA